MRTTGASEGAVRLGVPRPGTGDEEPGARGRGRRDVGEDVARLGVRVRACARVRTHMATAQDIPAATAAVRELLIELGGSPPSQVAMERAARALLADAAAGTLIVAEVDGALAGVLAASWQLALHAAGRYALIQDLWVDPEWRRDGVGRELLTALYRRAGELGMTRVEVGLPRESYPALAATTAFYAANGFRPLGMRMRRGLA